MQPVDDCFNQDDMTIAPIQPTALNGATPAVGPDPFDVDSLRLSQDFTASFVKKALLTVPVRKPSREWFIRTHPEDEYRLTTAVIELKEDREVYLVSPAPVVGARRRVYVLPPPTVDGDQPPECPILMASPFARLHRQNQ